MHKFQKYIILQTLLKNNNKLEYRWETNVKNFTMPVDVRINNKEVRIEATNNWQVIDDLKIKSLNNVEALKNRFYIKVDKL